MKNIVPKDSNYKIGRIIVVDDEAELMSALCDMLVGQGYETAGFLTGAEALAVLKEREFDLLLTDLMMPGMDGIELIRAGLEIDPNLIGIIMTGHGTVQTAVEAMKTGAFDYILKPFKLNTLLPLLSRAMQVRNLRLENMQLKETIAIHELGNAIAFSSDLNSILNKIADTALQQCTADEVSIMLPTKSGRELYVAVVRGGRTENLGEHAPIEQGIAGWVARNRESVVFRGEVNDPRMAPIRPRNDIHIAVSMPMLSQSKLVGVLNINITKSHRQFTLGQLKALNILVSIISPILENTSLYIQISKAEEEYRSIFENAREGIFRSLPGEQFITANPALARILGYDSPEDLVASVTDITRQIYVNPADAAEFARIMAAQGEVINFECQVHRKNGGRIWISVSTHAVRNEKGVLLYYEGTLEDVTNHKNSELNLKLAKEILETLNRPNDIQKLIYDILHLLKEYTGFEAIGIRLREGEDYPYYVTNGFPNHFLEAENYLCARDAAVEIIRDSKGNPYLEGRCGNVLCGRTDPSLPFFTEGGSFWANSTTKHLAEKSEKEYQGCIRNFCNAEGYESLALIPLRSGEEIIGLIQLSDTRQNLFTPDMICFLEGIGASIGIAVIRRQSVEKLRQSEEKHREIFENIMDVFYRMDNEGLLLIVSPSIEKLSGYAPDEIIGKKYGEFYTNPEEQDQFLAVLRKKGEVNGFEAALRAKDGSTVWVSTNAQFYRDEQGKILGVQGILHDITERKLAEDDLRNSLCQLQDTRDMLVRSDKLAAIGTLAAGVTHEILNPLNVISLYLQMWSLNEIPPEKMTKSIEVCQEQVERIVKISQDLNQFARVGPEEIVSGNINHLIEQTFNLIAPKLRLNNVEADLQLRSDLPSIPLDKNRLGQVFLNLVNNAIDGMATVPAKVLRVSTELVIEAEKELVRVVFADRGMGIPEEAIHKIFDPFFTTKEPGKGTGLGLSITYRIIQDHGGRIWVENNEWGGASFSIDLPVHSPSGPTSSQGSDPEE